MLYKKQIIPSLLLCVLLLGVGQAEDVFISNRPFKGEVDGAGKSIRLELRSLAESLDLTLSQSGDAWLLDGKSIPVSTIRGKTFMLASYLENFGYAVRPQPELGFVDIVKTEAVASTPKTTGSKEVLIPGKGIKGSIQLADRRSAVYKHYGKPDKKLEQSFSAEEWHYKDIGLVVRINDKGRVDRISVFSERFVTDKGLKVGVTLDRVEQIQGKRHGFAGDYTSGNGPDAKDWAGRGYLDEGISFLADRTKNEDVVIVIVLEKKFGS